MASEISEVLSSFDTKYRFVVSATDGGHAVVWSQPTAVQPVPTAVVHMYVQQSDSGLRFKFENETSTYSVDEVRTSIDARIRRLLTMKLSVVENVIDLREPFERTRLVPPETVATAEFDSEDEEKAVAIQKIARGRNTRRKLTAKREQKSAIAIQKIARGKRDRAAVAKLRAPDASNSAEEDTASGDNDTGADEQATTADEKAGQEEVGEEAGEEAGVGKPEPESGEQGASDATAEAPTTAEEASTEAPTAAEEASAVHLQRMARGREARKRVDKLKAEKQAEIESATLIQSQMRGQQARQQVQAMRAAKAANSNETAGTTDVGAETGAGADIDAGVDAGAEAEADSKPDGESVGS